LLGVGAQRPDCCGKVSSQLGLSSEKPLET
jgi:hypothetical protein